MHDEFVPLAAVLRPRPLDPPPLPPAADPDAPVAAEESDGEIVAAHAAALGDVRRFRAALCDALDAALEQMLAEIAENVLARELQFAPPDLASIVAKARERFAQHHILAVRVHPRDLRALETLTIEKLADDGLAPGDITIELRSGTIDLSLRSRLAWALSACLPG